jgi:hypothetical protein
MPEDQGFCDWMTASPNPVRLGEAVCGYRTGAGYIVHL